MIQVRDMLQVKFGKIDQAVELFTGGHDYAPFSAPEHKLGVLTDISGQMYTLVTEFVAPNLGAFEAARDASYDHKGHEDWFRQFQLFVEGGRREYFTVEGEYRSWSQPGMVVVRECYRSYKWQIETTIGLLKRYGGLLMDRGVGQNARILTDASGQMFQAVVEIETESLSAWEASRREVYRQIEFQVWFNQMLTSVEAGTHEFYRVEYSSG